MSSSETSDQLTPAAVAAVRRALLAWFDKHQRALPWRSEPTPYRVWLSEMMLQQTQVATALPYFERFVARYPDVQSLASADLAEVLALWAGLGYYARARHLHAAAKMVATDLAGRFPDTVAGLVALPGVGRYTAGAIASIAFGRPAPILDGNVARVLCRLLAIGRDAKAAETVAHLWATAERLVPLRRPGDFNQAMMDLGATVCSPRSPRCPDCPLRRQCRAHRAGQAEHFPIARPKPEPRPERWAMAAVWSGERLLLTRRPTSGRWGGLWQLPGLIVPPGADTAAALKAHLATMAIAAPSGEPVAIVRHALTHRAVTAELFACRVGRPPRVGEPFRWVCATAVDVAIDRLTAKAIEQAVRHRDGAATDPARLTQPARVERSSRPTRGRRERR